ncbi:hypothetical protein NOGI109294_26645 [Nocardiopsis gilva]|uniref:type I polyketide synthase n=1 Tax=Nocardiopsis gilva TaxID=280236 RepID=UPI00034BE581
MRFGDGVGWLLEQGVSTFIELGPDGSLTAMAAECSEAHRERDGGENGRVSLIPSMRPGQAEPERWVRALAEVHASGVDVDWAPLFPGARRTELPTYAFQHRHYWLDSEETRVGHTVNGATPADHPFLKAVIPLPGTDGTLFTGRISLRSHPWLADHAVGGTALLPGTAIVGLALHAGDHTGAPHLDELTLHAPLSIPADGATAVQVTVGPADDDDRRPVTVHSRPARASGDTGTSSWTLHAEGTLTRHTTPGASAPSAWPPPNAESIDIDGTYERLAGLGYEYGPAFQGLQAVWRVGDEILAEVCLPTDRHSEAIPFGLHPALLDAAQHGIAIGDGAIPDEEIALPFSWSGVTLHADGATDLRVRLSRTGPSTFSLTATDPAGAPVVTIGALTLRPMNPSRAATTDDLFILDWAPLPDSPATRETDRWALLDSNGTLGSVDLTVTTHPDLASLRASISAGAPVPQAVVLPCLPDPDGPHHVADEARTALHAMLDLLHDWLDDDRLESTQLVVVTSGAVAAHADDDITDLAHAPLWGMLRTAQTEHPGRLVAIDVDDVDAALPLLPDAVASGEPGIAIRDGHMLAPRLARPPEPRGTSLPALPADGTVLITGATGTLGGEVARHLVTSYGVRHLLLLGRSGGRSAAAAELAADLTELGAEVSFAACDAADLPSVERALDGIPAEHPLSAVVHIAGVLDDGVLTSLTPERIDRVIRPKIDAAWNLHKLTGGHDLSAFVMFSSAAGLLGAPGQANYAAANTFLDALAHHRRAAGLPATSLSWGLWGQRTGMTGHLDATDLNRMTRMGMAAPLDTEQGLAHVDTALRSGVPHMVPLPLDLPGVRGRASRAGEVPPLFRGLVRPPRRRAAGAAGTGEGALREQVADLSADAAEQILTNLVRARAADVLGHADADKIDPEREFLEAGFDSLTAVELRNQLNDASGLRLPPALIFTYPTPQDLGRHLAGELTRNGPSAEDASMASQQDEPADAVLPDSLVTLFRQTCQLGRIDDGIRMVEAAAQVRPTFGHDGDPDGVPAPVRLAQGDAQPALMCFASLVMISGSQEYARFAAPLRGARDVTVLPEPGFRPGERLPEDADVAIESQVRAVLSCIGESGQPPFCLVGRSSGGWIAHAVAARLEARGVFPHSVVLIDTPLPDASATLPVIETAVLHREQQLGLMDTARVTAMGGYLRMFADWKPEPITTPTLLVRPEGPVTGPSGEPLGGPNWRFAWHLPHTVLDVPGNHLTMMEEHAEATARALDAWLTESRVR